MAEPNVLSLIEQRVPFTTSERHWLFFRREIKTWHIHLDFVVDGIPLREYVRRWSGLLEAPEDVSRMTDFHPAGAIEQIDRLRGVQPHRYRGRAWLLFCPLCGDEGCGGLTADLSMGEDRVQWSNFGWDTDCEPDDGQPVRIGDKYSLTFDRARYERVLLEARERFSSRLTESA